MGSSDITPITPVEVIHRLSKLETRSDDHSDAINAMATRLAVGDEILETISKQLNEIEGTIKWIGRVVLTAVLGAIVALVLKDGPSVFLHGTGSSSSPAASP